jgi:hypothetical protein
MGVYLISVHLMGVYLMSVHLMCVHLTGVHLTGMYLTGVCLMACTEYLMGVYFTSAHLIGVSHRRDLTGVHLIGVHLTGMHLTGVYLIVVHFTGVHHRMQPFLLILVVRTWSWPDAAFLILALSDNLTLLSLGPSAAATHNLSSQGKLSARSSRVKLIPTYNFYLSFQIFQLHRD